MSVLQPTTTEIAVTLIAFVVVIAMVVALIDALRRSDAVSALLLVRLGPVGLMIYVVRRSAQTAA